MLRHKLVDPELIGERIGMIADKEKALLAIERFNRIQKRAVRAWLRLGGLSGRLGSNGHSGFLQVSADNNGSSNEIMKGPRLSLLSMVTIQ